jgi:hypothetical protein
VIAAILLAVSLPAGWLAPAELEQAPAGAWLEWELRVRDLPPVYVRLAALDVVEGARRMELWISARPGSASQVYQALVAGDRIERLLVRWGTERVHELSTERVPALLGVLPAPCTGRGCRRPRERPIGSCTTRAGDFPCVERTLSTRGTRVRLLVAPGLPLGGLLRVDLAGTTAELVGSGQGALPAIPAGAAVVPLGSAP